MNATKTTILAAVAGLAALMMTGGAFAKTFEALYTVNIHSRATASSRIVDKLYEGERVKIILCDNDWCEIAHDGPDGWVPVASLENINYGDDSAPTIVFEGGINFPHPNQPPVIVDPGPKKPPFKNPIVGQLPIGGLLPINGGGNTGGSGGSNSGGTNHGPICQVGHPCLQQP